jgi:tetratricopeptide (TPR) repeat protein
VDERFEILSRLCDGPEPDPMIRWMAAVQCRSWNRNAEGAEHYRKLLAVWKPGPVLVHQTYANLLDNLGRYEESLAERRQAVELEPAGWSYDGLGYTLYCLKRLEEAEEANAEAVRREPLRSSYWRNWARTLLAARRPEEASEKAARAVRLDSRDAYTWLMWGECLQAEGKGEEALAKKRRAASIQPGNGFLREEVRRLEQELENPAMQQTAAP